MRKLLPAAFFMFCLPGTSALGQSLDPAQLGALPKTERHRALIDFNVERADSATLAALFPALQKMAEASGDAKTKFLVGYSKFLARRVLKTPLDQTISDLDALHDLAKRNELRAEEIVAAIYRTFEERDQKKARFEETYVGVLLASQSMEDIGIEAFRDYRPDFLLRYIGRFFYDNEDNEQALKFLQLGEKHMHCPTDRARYCFLILNTIQTIFQREKDFENGLLYARKILDLAQKLPEDNGPSTELKNLWTGIATVDIAAMLVEQRKFAEGEVLADQGYQLVLHRTVNETSQAEYDVLQVLIPIKLGLKKLAEAEKLIRRAEALNATLDKDPKTSPFKHIRFFDSCAKYHEMNGRPDEALRFYKLSQALADSLERHNDARKFEKIKQRQAAEKYAAQLQFVESERHLQTTLRNAALLILLLTAGMAYVNFKRLQAKRRLALADLEAARQDLATFTQGFREKSDLAENLRTEIENLANRGQRSQYLEQLTSSTILTDEDWVRFRSVFEKVHPDFISEQKTLYPDLTQAELRYLVLEKLGLNTHEMANMLGVSDGTIRQTRSRLRKKTGT